MLVALLRGWVWNQDPQEVRNLTVHLLWRKHPKKRDWQVPWNRARRQACQPNKRASEDEADCPVEREIEDNSKKQEENKSSRPFALSETRSQWRFWVKKWHGTFYATTERRWMLFVHDGTMRASLSLLSFSRMCIIIKKLIYPMSVSVFYKWNIGKVLGFKTVL